MKYKKFIAINKIVFWIILLGTFTFAQTNWIGKYEFYEDGGKTAGGTKIFVEHTLTIKQENEKLKAHLYSQGYMTSYDINADVKIVDDKLMLYFSSKGEDHISDYFKKGDLLLTLERKTKNGKSKILTYWQKFEPIVPANEKSGEVYFKKSSNNTAISADKELEKHMRELLQNNRYVYVAKVLSQKRIRSGEKFRGRHGEMVDDYVDSNRLLIEKNLKGTSKKQIYLRTNSLKKGGRYLIFADYYTSPNKFFDLDKSNKELEVLEKILAEK